MKNYIKIVATFLLLSLVALTSTAAEGLNFNENLPMMVDSQIELTHIFHEDKNITYVYQLKNISYQDAENAKEEHQFFVEKKACNDEYVQYILGQNMNLKFIYKIEDQQILEVKVDKNFCDKLNLNHRVV